MSSMTTDQHHIIHVAIELSHSTGSWPCVCLELRSRAFTELPAAMRLRF